MALIKSVKDDEERKRKQQAQANQTAQSAANKSAQMNSDAAKRNSAGVNKAPTQSAADVIKAAKAKAQAGTVTKTPKQYANPAQYVKKSNPVRQTFNYETLGTQERVDQVASWIVDPNEKQAFLDGWTAYTNTGEYRYDQYKKYQLQGLAGLYDADGRAININTASYATVVQGIRSIADKGKRKEAAERLKEMTETWGSRFYGQAFDEDITNSYLGNPDFDEQTYKDETSRYANAFYAQSGYDSQNAEAYLELYDDIENSGYTDAVQRQLKEALNASWETTTGKVAPGLRQITAARAALQAEKDAAEADAKQKAEDSKDIFQKAWEAFSGWWKQDAEDVEEGAEEEPKLPGGAVETGKTASASVVDSPYVEKPAQQEDAPREAQGPGQQPHVTEQGNAGAPSQAMTPGDYNYETQTGSVDLASDPIKAIIEYTDKGMSDQLTDATKKAINEYVSSSPGISALWGVLSDENLREFAYLDENGQIVSEKNNRTADNIYRDNYGILGYEMSRYALKIKDNAFPAALREDAAGVLSNIVEAAEREASLPEMSGMYDTDFVNIYEQYLENHPEAKQALVDAFAYEDEVRRSEREARELADAQAQITEQQALAVSQEACKNGLGTPEDWDRVASAAAQVTKEQLYDDEFYLDMRTEIGIARSSSDRDIGNLDDWYNEKTSEWLAANGIEVDLTKLPAIQYKDMLQGYVLDALDQVATTAYSLGYKSLSEYNEKTGVLNGDLLYQIAANNMQKEEAAITEEVAAEAERIAYGGTDNSFEMWAQGIAYSAKTGFVDQTAAQGYEAIYNFAASTNLTVDTSRARATYVNRYGYAEAADAYIDHMTQLADGGYFPSEELANHVKNVLASGGDPFALGIMPEDMGWAAEGARRNQQQVAEYQAWAQENLTEAQGLAAEVTFTTANNTATQLIAKGLNIVTGGGSAAAQIISSMIAYGGFGGSYNEGFRAALDNGRGLRGANIMGTTESFAVAVANLESDKSFTSNFMGMLGLNSAVEMAIDEIGVPAANRLWRSTLAGLKGVGESLVDEVLKDEIKEGLWKAGLGGGMESLLDATGEMTALPKASDMLRAAGAALGNIDVLGTLTDVIGSAPENAIHMLPMALLSGTTKGVTDWKSYQSLKTAVKTGDPADMKQAAQDIVEDMQDPEKAQAFDEGVSAAQKGKQAAHIMLTDEEISPMLESAQKANEQHRSHTAKAEASQTAINTAVKSMTSAQQKIDNGTADETDVQMVIDSAESIAKNKTSLEESTREAAQKKAESDKLYEQAENAAMAKANQQITEQRTAMAEEMNATQQERVAQAEMDNITALEADNFVNERYPNATPEQRQRLLDQYNAVVRGRVDSDFRSVDMAVRQFKKKFKNINFTVVDSLAGSEGGYVRDRNTVYIARDMTYGEIANRVITHELTHASEAGGKAYEQLRDALLNLRYKGDQEQLRADILSKQNQYNDHFAQNNIMDDATGEAKKLSEEEAMQEIVAQINSEILSGNEEMINRLVADQPSVARRIWETVKDFLQKVGVIKDTEIDQLRRVEKMFEKALKAAGQDKAQPVQRTIRTDVAVSPETNESLVGEIDDTAVQYSLRSWTEEERDTVRTNLLERGFAATDVEQWIDDVDGVARIIAADKDRLDFTAADNQVMLKPNQEYVKTLDASTLCAKRLLYQGTFNAIQHAMPDSVITSDGLIKLRNMMAEMGYETPCGICYVESRRRNLGTFAKQWLDSYDAGDGYQPKLDDVTTTDGLERMRTEHPEVYKSFTDEMNRKGSNNPKVVQLRTDYRGDIRSLTKKQAEKIVEIGGLRVQSFSDFETPHLLDMMQAVLDMTDKGLTSQAYTKVPNFAAVFGDTGIKINLSLIADGNGLDENGNLVFSSYEGMDFDRAMELRDMYSKNVGTILVGVNDDHIKAAMADPRIDYIIPFHKSGWGQRQLESLTGMRDYEDYTADQNEKRVKGQTKGGKVTYKNVSENFHPVDYWDYSKSGKENAEEYLRMCAEDGRVPKFSQFLKDNGDGSYSLPEDGSADGYWKLLIDFKMYDNDGVGSPQMPVMPNFNMEEAQRVLDEYEGGADSLPVAQDVVDRYVNEFNGMQFSVRDEEKNPMTKQDFGAFYAKIGEMKAGKSDQFARAANGDYILAIKDKLVYTDGNWDNPSISSVVEILLDDETDIDAMREVWYEYENGDFSEDTAIAIGKSLHQKEVFRRSDFRDSGRDQYSAGRGKRSGSKKDSLGNGRVKYSLPSDDSLISEMQAYHALQNQPEPEQAQQIPNEEKQPKPQGERQFTVKTLQKSPAVPQWLKNELYNNPEARFYEKDTNNDQIVRSWERLQKEGYEAMRDRVLSSDAQNPDNVADANMILAMANREGDTKTFLDVALHYAKEGTQTAKTLQARKIFSRMTPTGMKVWASGQAESNLAKYIDEHRPIKRKVDRAAKKVAEKIKDLQGGDELLRLQAAGEYTITSEDARWGVPINEKQRALIKEYRLEKVARPGVDHYNRATTKQRMLEAILAEPNPENVTGNGLNLIQRLEYMKNGAAVITNADLDYIGRQMVLYAHSPVDDQEGRVGDLALARLYEAYGNITPATMAEKAKTWRYTAMLLSFPSAARNVIGNAAQNAVNATAHSVATVLDWGVSKVTGERTVAGLTFKERADGWAAFRDETINTIRDFYTDKAITSHGEDRYNLNQRGRVYQNGTLEMMRLTEGFLMSVGDRNFWKKAYVNSLAEQQRVADLNGEAFDYEAACERAEAEANYATFNEDSRVRDLLTQLKHPPEDASFKDKALAMAIDFLMPFTGVPTNITKRMIDYSPAGLAFTALEHGIKAAQGKNFDQNAFVNGMARGLTGTALLAIGMELFKAGLVSLGTGEEEDKKIYGAETAQGRQYTPYIRVGDQYIALSTFMPAASAIIMGATAQKVFENDENALNAIKSACFASLDMIFDASYMSSLADIFGGYGTLGENAVDSLVNSTISQNVPAILGQIASAMDPYVRDTKDKNAIMQALKSGLISKIPGLRQQLEAKVDITGEKVKNSKYGVALVDPFTRSYANDDPALQELIDFVRESGDNGVIPELFVKSNKYEVAITKTQAKALKVNRGKGANGKIDYQALTLDVTDEEKWDLNEKYGKLVFGELRKLLESRKWKRAEEAERIKLAEEIIKDAKLDILEDFLKERNVK